MNAFHFSSHLAHRMEHLRKKGRRRVSLLWRRYRIEAVLRKGCDHYSVSLWRSRRHIASFTNRDGTVEVTYLAGDWRFRNRNIRARPSAILVAQAA